MFRVSDTYVRVTLGNMPSQPLSFLMICLMALGFIAIFAACAITEEENRQRELIRENRKRAKLLAREREEKLARIKKLGVPCYPAEVMNVSPQTDHPAETTDLEQMD